MYYWVVVAVMALYGLACLIFAVIEPPAWLGSFFRVPAIFVFLPDRHVVPVGRAFVGLCSLGVAAFLVTRFLAVP
jgi:hypothetical protein